MKESIKTTFKKVVRSKKGPIKLNIGCGTDYKKGWVNIDNNSDNNIKKLDLNWDLRNPLPYKEGTVDFIFNEHFFEHLDVEEARTALKDLLRVLKKGGVLRIAMPDLEWVVDNYLNLPLEKDPLLKNKNLQFIKTRAERLNMSFSWWGHKWLYDWEELERRAKEVGVKKIVRCKLGQSKYQDLRNLETRPESLLVAEITK